MKSVKIYLTPDNRTAQMVAEAWQRAFGEEIMKNPIILDAKQSEQKPA